jgi:hypothetical protein
MKYRCHEAVDGRQEETMAIAYFEQLEVWQKAHAVVFPPQ